MKTFNKRILELIFCIILLSTILCYSYQKLSTPMLIVLVGIILYVYLVFTILLLYGVKIIPPIYDKFISLNNYDYDKVVRTSKRDIPLPIGIISVVIYYLIFSFYCWLVINNIIIVFLSALCSTVLVRGLHYHEPEMGEKVGKLIGEFVVPFGIGIMAGKFFEMSMRGIKFSITEIFDTISWFTFFLFLILSSEIIYCFMRDRKK